eukprot:275313_1
MGSKPVKEEPKSQTSSDQLKDMNTLQCNHSYNQCQIMKSLLRALEFYSTLNIIADSKSRDSFDTFINHTYCKLIDHYIHFNNHHSHELEAITSELNDKTMFGQCQISKCAFTSRHHTNTTAHTLNPTLDFFKHTLDSLHFYVYHCFDVGIRTKTHTVQQKEEKEENKEDRYFDASFSRLNKTISQTRHITKSFNRFSLNPNNKFSLKTNNINMKIIEDSDEHDAEGETVYLDELYKQLKMKNVSKSAIEKLKKFTTAEEYDSEAFEYDITIYGEEGNIAQIIRNDECIKTIKKLLQIAKDCSNYFCVGLRFYYWEYYKELKQLPENEQRINDSFDNSNDHSGYTICNLFIRQKHASFREEILEEKYITHEEYIKMVVIKVNAYIKSDIVKATKPVSFGAPYMNRYGISKGCLLSFEHLLSLVIYCDYNELSFDFSSSFRSIYWFETLSHIKKRNGKYYYLSKFLRETVEGYGQCSAPEDITKEGIQLSGPFYCGMNQLLHMPALNIRLCAPASTSIHMEVAIKFSTEDGIIIQFDNPATSPQYSYLRGFNVSWISRYKEESERLFFGGFYYVKIQSVRVRPTKQNFEEFINAMYYLDTMLTGGRQDNIPTNTTDINVIKTLVDNILGNTRKITMQKYVFDTFDAFIANKKHVTLDLVELASADHQIRDLIMHPLDERKPWEESKRADSDTSNLFRKVLLLVFTNVQTIIINTSFRHASYSLSMMCLLSIFQMIDEETNGSLNEIIVKSDRHNKWISNLWCSDAHILKEKYNSSKLTISIKQEAGVEKNECWFLIKRTN